MNDGSDDAPAVFHRVKGQVTDVGDLIDQPRPGRGPAPAVGASRGS